MGKWIGRVLLAVAGFVAMLGALYVTCYDVPKDVIETARAKLERSKTEFGTRLEGGGPGAKPSQPTGDEQATVQANTARLGSLVSRCKTFHNKSRSFWAIINTDPSQRTEDQWKEAEALLQEYASVLDELRVFLRGKPKCASPEFTPASYNEVTQDLFVGWLERLLMLSAQVAAHSGNLDAAVEDVARLFQLAATAAPLAFSGGDAWQDAQRTVANAFPEGTLTEAQSARLMALAADTLPDRRAFAVGFADDVDLFSMFLSDDFLEQESRRNPSMLRDATILVTGPFRSAEVANMLAAADEILALADRPYYEVHDQLEAIRQQEQRSVYTNPFALRVPSWTGFFVRQVTQEARLDLLRLGLNIELYKVENGAYPPTLDAIAATVGGGLPLDPFTGQPYRYQASDAGFLLYSPGPNQADDGGGGDDVVWREKRANGPATKSQQAKK